MLKAINNGERYQLTSPTAMPQSASFLWNKKMMIQVNCRGYAVAQFMQPEPAKYAYAPNLEAKTFMQPEQPYYAHHPGRFFYIKDEETGEIFSAPYEPVRSQLNNFSFNAGKSDISWHIAALGIEVELCLSLPVDDVVELWELKIKNSGAQPRKLSIYPYFPVGYMSWMNQSGDYSQTAGGIIASCVTPYQKVADYFKNKDFKDKTFFLHETAPDAWEVNQKNFEGEGGLHNPSAIQQETLGCGNALYETPTAVLQYRRELAAQEQQTFRFIFGPAFDESEAIALRNKYLSAEGFAKAKSEYQAYITSGKGCLQINTPDPELNNFVNHWLPRQVFYHGDVNRLTTDPQTRNYIQDNMGMSYIKPNITRQAFLHALSQQEESGAMPDGILLLEGAELKYINQIPHTDHCVSLPVCMQAYLDETNDYALLDEIVPYASGEKRETVEQHMHHAMRWLLQARDERGLSFIAQGDWCDPMNMVGYKGKGVSGWLSVATAYALNLWADVCEQRQQNSCANEFRQGAKDINTAVNKHIWDGEWFGRGITDDGVLFGTSKDKEGRIFLNPQSWAILGGAADEQKIPCLLDAVEQQLETPYGVMMLAPAFTAMRDDVGRVTQKFPGSAENGSVYNHAAVFYIFSLLSIGESERAYKLLRQMLPGPDEADLLQRGQLPVFIPNYYRGAYYQHPRTAGRSSQLFNTGTVSWVYRCLIEGVFGLKGSPQGLVVQPQLPAAWQTAEAVREFRGATFNVSYRKTSDIKEMEIQLNESVISGNTISDITAGATYQLTVLLPATN